MPLLFNAALFRKSSSRPISTAICKQLWIFKELLLSRRQRLRKTSSASTWVTMMSSAPTCSSLAVPNKVYKDASAQWRSMAGQALATSNNYRPGTLPKRAANKTSRISPPSRRQRLMCVLVPERCRQSQTLCLKAWRHLPVVWNASRELSTISMRRSIQIYSLPRKKRTS